MERIITVESSKKQSRLLAILLYKGNFIYLILSFTLLLFILFTQQSISENPILFGLLGILTFYSFLFQLIFLLTKKVYKVQYDINTVTFYYHYLLSTRKIIWNTDSTIIQLYALKDHQSFFTGFEIEFKNNIQKAKLKLIENSWTDADLELIYLEFKKRKKEAIAENEKDLFEQLHLMAVSKH